MLFKRLSQMMFLFCFLLFVTNDKRYECNIYLLCKYNFELWIHLSAYYMNFDSLDKKSGRILNVFANVIPIDKSCKRVNNSYTGRIE